MKIPGASRPIPMRYVPKRVVGLYAQRKINREQLWGAAMFCYYEELHWLNYAGVSTNFPKGYKVQTSVRKSGGPRGDWAQVKPDGYDGLRMFLIEGLSMREIAIAKGLTGSARTLHRKGFEYCRQMLALFAKSIGY